MSLTTDQAREILDACLEEEGIHDNGSARRDIAARHFARDIEAADERDAHDLDRVPAWFLRIEPAYYRYLVYVAAVAFVVAWMIH